MILVVMRHGEACPAVDATLTADEGRALTENGILEVEAATKTVIEYLMCQSELKSGRQSDIPVTTNLSIHIAASHLVRARQTLALVAAELDQTEALEGYHLLPDNLHLYPSASPHQLLQQLDPALVKLHNADDLKNTLIILCTHRPFIDRLTEFLSSDTSLVDFSATASWVVMHGDWPVKGGMTIEKSHSQSS